MKLMSLFDGSGGFPLAAKMCGIEPVACSEIEPYPIAVTCSRFPNMVHYGDVSKVRGDQVEPVDIISFGSPCQDLSVAGLRKGLKHTENGDDETTRSGLFMEAVRIIKEMREKTNGVYPRFAVWENVPGAFSSNHGEDFRIVLEEMCKIKEPNAKMPACEGGWPYADVYLGDGWSVAYRTFDAQYWGVPQRRRRIYLVADFAGERAGEILFNQNGLRGYFTQSRETRQTAAEDAEGGSGAGCFQNTGAGWWNESDVAATLRTTCGGDSTKANLVCFDARGNGDGKTVNTVTGYHNDRITDFTTICIQGNCIDRSDTAGCNGKGWREDQCYTLNTIDRPAVVFGNGQVNQSVTEDVAGTLNCMHDQQCVCYGLDCRNGRLNGDLCGTLQAKPDGGFSYNCIHPVIINIPPKYIVRRLTPTECARLQGFPDEWGIPDKLTDFTREQADFWQEVFDTHAEINGKKKHQYSIGRLLQKYNALHTDSAEYKMWGNGIALPNALYVMQGIADVLMEDEHE